MESQVHERGEGGLNWPVARHNIKVAHISPGYSAYLNLDKNMITRVPYLMQD